MHEQIAFDEEKHEYLVAGKKYLSVTGIIKAAGLSVDFSKIPEEALEYARVRGKEVHLATHLDDADDLGECDPVIVPYVEGWRRFKQDFNVKILESEMPVFSAKYRYCGTLDRIAEVNKTLAIIDIKTSATVELKSVSCQLYAYRQAYCEYTDQLKQLNKIKMYVVKLMPDGKYKMAETTDKNAWNVFLYALSIENYKKIKHERI
jgi:hypothetical protein